MKRVKKTPFPSIPILQDAEVLGAAVRACRTEAGMTIDEAAMSLGVAKQTLHDLEMGKPTVGLGLVLKITQGLGLSLIVLQKHNAAYVINNLVSELKKDSH
jgi:DNA-binding XRE family transcriptional regulator